MVGRGRRALQVVSAVLGIIPVVTGLIGLRGLEDPLCVLHIAGNRRCAAFHLLAAPGGASGLGRLA
jgi:hypothetical protein